MTDKENGGNETAVTENNEEPKTGRKIVVHDDSSFSQFLDSSKFAQLQRVASVFSGSGLVPEHYQGKIENCMLAVHMAMRLEMDPFTLMQSTYVLKGKFGMEGKLAIALINSSGLFDQPLKFETEGEIVRDGKGFVDWDKTTFKCRAWTVKDDERINGMWITPNMVTAEGWHLDKGTQKSKWETLPDLMFRYRAGTFFGRLNCPERLMGMQTVEEIEDVAYEEVKPDKPKRITSSQAIEEARKRAESNDLQDEAITTLPEESSQDSEDVAQDAGVSDDTPEVETHEEVDTETGEVQTTEQGLIDSAKPAILKEFERVSKTHKLTVNKYREKYGKDLEKLTSIDAANQILDELKAIK